MMCECAGSAGGVLGPAKVLTAVLFEQERRKLGGPEVGVEVDF